MEGQFQASQQRAFHSLPNYKQEKRAQGLGSQRVRIIWPGTDKAQASGALQPSWLGLCDLPGYLTSLCLSSLIWKMRRRVCPLHGLLCSERACVRGTQCSTSKICVPPAPSTVVIIVVLVVLVITLSSSLICLRDSWNFKVLRRHLVKCPSFSCEEAEARERRGLAKGRGGAGALSGASACGVLSAPDIVEFAGDTQTMLMWTMEGHMWGQRRGRSNFRPMMPTLDPQSGPSL